MLSLGNTPSALNEKTKNVFFDFSALFSLFSALFPLPSKPPEVPPEGGAGKKRVGPPLAASFGDFWRPLLESLFSYFFSPRSSLFSLLSSLFSLSSWSCEARSHESSRLERFLERLPSGLQLALRRLVWWVARLASIVPRSCPFGDPVKMQ